MRILAVIEWTTESVGVVVRGLRAVSTCSAADSVAVEDWAIPKGKGIEKREGGEGDANEGNKRSESEGLGKGGGFTL